MTKEELEIQKLQLELAEAKLKFENYGANHQQPSSGKRRVGNDP